MSTQSHNPFWEYSLAVYTLPEVRTSCLALQDACDLDVNFLLYAAWLASRGEALSAAHLGRIDAQVSAWRLRVIQPLRALRLQLREYEPAFALRREVQALELRAERQQQDMMYNCYCTEMPLPSSLAALHDNLAQVAGASIDTSPSCQAQLPRLETALAAAALEGDKRR